MPSKAPKPIFLLSVSPFPLWSDLSASIISAYLSAPETLQLFLAALSQWGSGRCRSRTLRRVVRRASQNHHHRHHLIVRQRNHGSRGWCLSYSWRTSPCSCTPCTSTIAPPPPERTNAFSITIWRDSLSNLSGKTPSLALPPPRMNFHLSQSFLFQYGIFIIFGNVYVYFSYICRNGI